MASRRILKKQLNALTFDIIEESFNIQLSDAKKTDETNDFITEVVEYRNSFVEKLHVAKTKAEIRPLIIDLEAKGEAFLDRLNKIG